MSRSYWWCWHCMDFVGASTIAVIEDGGGQTGYCQKHPYRDLLPTKPATHLQRKDSMPAPILKYFAFSHLPDSLQEVSKPICEIAIALDSTLPDGAEKSAGLRKLLEAKDCFVRAKLG